MILSFLIGMLAYLTVKVNRDIKKKFETDEGESESESHEGEESASPEND